MYIHVEISYFCCIPSPSHNDAACSSHARKSVIGCIGPFCTSPCGLIKMLEKKKKRERELTVCFETTFDDAAQRKRARYAKLQQSARDAGYQTAIATLEVGSRGIINYCGFSSLKKHLQIREREFGALLQSLSVEALLQSFRIWCLRNHQP